MISLNRTYIAQNSSDINKSPAVPERVHRRLDHVLAELDCKCAVGSVRGSHDRELMRAASPAVGSFRVHGPLDHVSGRSLATRGSGQTGIMLGGGALVRTMSKVSSSPSALKSTVTAQRRRGVSFSSHQGRGGAHMASSGHPWCPDVSSPESSNSQCLSNQSHNP